MTGRCVVASSCCTPLHTTRIGRQRLGDTQRTYVCYYGVERGKNCVVVGTRKNAVPKARARLFSPGVRNFLKLKYHNKKKYDVNVCCCRRRRNTTVVFMPWHDVSTNYIIKSLCNESQSSCILRKPFWIDVPRNAPKRVVEKKPHLIKKSIEKRISR